MLSLFHVNPSSVGHHFIFPEVTRTHFEMILILDSHTECVKKIEIIPDGLRFECVRDENRSKIGFHVELMIYSVCLYFYYYTTSRLIW